MTTNNEIRKCDFVKSNGDRCGRKFRNDDANVTLCFQHRAGLFEPIKEERALVLFERKPDERTFKVNVGEALIGQDEIRLYVLIASAISMRIGIELKTNAFVSASIGTKESAVVLRADAAQFLMMTFPSKDAEVLVTIGGDKSYRLRVSTASDEWSPAVVKEICQPCFATGQVTYLHDNNRFVVKVSLIATENKIEFEEVNDEDLRANSVCPFHGHAANRIATDEARESKKIGKDDRIFVYGPYEGPYGEGPFLRHLKKRDEDSRRRTKKRDEDSRRAEAEFSAVFNKSDLFKLGDIAAEKLAARKKRRGQ